MQKELNLQPMAKPFLPQIEELIEPRAVESALRALIPAWQTHYTSDDYTEMSWHAPTARFYVGRPALRAPEGFIYPDWVMNALGGIAETIDPMIMCAGKTIAGAIIDLLTDKAVLARAKTEFVERTGGGIDGDRWQKPLCDYPPPTDFPWPRYVETANGREWWIPETEADRRLHP
jgi:aminobenzoyl-glutamate utilization protein B